MSYLQFVQLPFLLLCINVVYHNSDLFWIHHWKELSVVNKSIVVNVCLIDYHLNLSLCQSLPHKLHDQPEFAPGWKALISEVETRQLCLLSIQYSQQDANKCSDTKTRCLGMETPPINKPVPVSVKNPKRLSDLLLCILLVHLQSRKGNGQQLEERLHHLDSHHC